MTALISSADLLHDTGLLAGFSGLTYTAATTITAMIAVFAPTKTRRDAAAEVLKILLRVGRKVSA